MISNFLWIFLLILQCGIVTPRSTPSHREKDDLTSILPKYNYEAQNKPKEESNEDQVISVRITSSIAVGRSNPRPFQKSIKNTPLEIDNAQETLPNPPTEFFDTQTTESTKNDVNIAMTELPPNLVGANIEFIRQLNAKKDAKSHVYLGQVHPFQLNIQNHNETEFSSENSSQNEDYVKNNDKLNLQISNANFQEAPQPYNPVADSLAEPSIKSVLGTNDKGYDYKTDNEQLLTSKTQIPSYVRDDINLKADYNKNTEDTVVASSIQSISTLINKDESDENIENVPLARSLPFSPSSKNYIQGLTNKPPSERGNSPSLTTVNFNIVHDTPKQTTDYNAQSNIYTNQGNFDHLNKFYEPPKVYSQPSKIYSEPAKFYSEPAKIYSEPAKVYSEPAKVYSEPAKVYSEPAKFYSPPASLHLTPGAVPNFTPWQDPTLRTDLKSTFSTTTSTTVTTIPPSSDSIQRAMHESERNYEVDEKVSVLTDGRSHGVQETSTEKCKEDNCKVGYVVEGRQYKKYRVEERTPDGFLVGEYGVVRNEDGALRGVRYTADSDASPRLIYDALMKFLQLK